MRKVIYSMGVSLDGYIAGPNGEIDWSGPDEELHRFQEQPGKDLAVGGAGLASTLTRLGLIDEYGLFVSPVVVGGGTPYFPALEAG
jgi:dihydrofolate reductase